MKRYFYNPSEDKVEGPHALSVLRAMVEAEEILESCQICAEGTEEWFPLSAAQTAEENEFNHPEDELQQALPQSSFRKEVEAFLSKYTTLREDDRINALCFDLEEGEPVNPDAENRFIVEVVNPAIAHIAPTILELEGSDSFPMPILIGDATMMRGLKNGIVITESHIFWKNQMEPEDCLAIVELKSVQFNSGMLGHTISMNDKEFEGGMINKQTVEEIASVIDFMRSRFNSMQLR